MRGTYRPHRHAGKDPTPVGELMAPPRYLSASQRRRWRQIIAAAPPKLLRAWDESALASFIIAEEVVVETNLARQAGASRSLLEVNTHGTLSISPLLRLQAQYLPILRALGSELGFSPASRAGLRLPEDDSSSGFDAGRWDDMLEAAQRNQAKMKAAYARQRAQLTLVEEESTDADAAPEIQTAVEGEEQDGELAAVEPVPSGVPPEAERDGEGLRRELEGIAGEMAPGES
jgi:P27 family predicted phage terminase small subunit